MLSSQASRMVSWSEFELFLKPRLPESAAPVSAVLPFPPMPFGSSGALSVQLLRMRRSVHASKRPPIARACEPPPERQKQQMQRAAEPPPRVAPPPGRAAAAV